jgi:hypothetical protein
VVKLTIVEPSDTQAELMPVNPETINAEVLQLTMLCSLSQFVYQTKDVDGVITIVTRSEDLKDDFIKVTAAPAPDVFDLVHLYISILNTGIMVISLLSLFFGKVNIRMNAPS